MCFSSVSFFLLHLKYKPDCPSNQEVLKDYGECLTWMQESSLIYISYESKPLETALSLISEAINQFWIVTVTRGATKNDKEIWVFVFTHFHADNYDTSPGACTIERVKRRVSINIVDRAAVRLIKTKGTWKIAEGRVRV